MAESTVTQTGVKELRERIERLPENVTRAMRGVAEQIGFKVRNTAEALLLEATSRDKTPDTRAERTAAAITLEVDEANKTVTVESKAPSGVPANLTIWFEHGTVRMAPKPYMRPAAKAHEAEYRRGCEAAVTELAERELA